MRLSVGDKVRVYFYPPKATHSFVEGVIDRNEINTFWGLSFSLRTTREVILGREDANTSEPAIHHRLREGRRFRGADRSLGTCPARGSAGDRGCAQSRSRPRNPGRA